MCQNENCNCKKPYYITTAIAYTSGKPHIGNTYEIVLADSIARFKREQGYDVRFQTGTDEHGQKIELKAEAAGVSPKEFVDGVAGQIQGIWVGVIFGAGIGGIHTFEEEVGNYYTRQEIDVYKRQ